MRKKRKRKTFKPYPEGSHSMKKTIILAAVMTMILMAFTQQVLAAEEAPQQVLFKNVNVFNGTENKLYEGLNVLITGNKIDKIGKGVAGRPDATVIDGEGRTLMPGFWQVREFTPPALISRRPPATVTFASRRNVTGI